MKVVASHDLDTADRKRFSELSPRIDADLERDREYDEAQWNNAFCRALWKRQIRSRWRPKRS